MFFLLRAAFWFSLVLLFLPIWPSGQQGDEQPVSALTALFAAREAAGDLAGICERKPEVCDTGRKAIHTITVKAKESARIAYEMLDDVNTTGTANPEGLAEVERPDVPIPPARP